LPQESRFIEFISEQSSRALPEFIENLTELEVLQLWENNFTSSILKILGGKWEAPAFKSIFSQAH